MNALSRLGVVAAIVIAAVTLAGCSEFSLTGEFSGPGSEQLDESGSGPGSGSETDPVDEDDSDDGDALSIYPAGAALTFAETQVFEGRGGAGGYTYSVQGGGTIDTSGTYTAPSVAGTFTVVVTDSDGDTDEAFVYVADGSLSISPTSATVAPGGTKQFYASGGSGSYAFDVADSSFGSINSSGLFTASSSKTSGQTTIELTDGSSTVTATITIQQSGGPLTISADATTIAQSEETDITVSGGMEPYSLDISASDLENDKNNEGEIVDEEYRASNSIGTVTIEVTDGDGATASIVITIVPEAPSNLVADGDNGDNHRIDLSWEHPKPLPSNNSGFVIERSVEGGSWSKLTEVGPSATSYTDTDGLSPSMSFYTYRVRAFADDKNYFSDYSNTSSSSSNP